MRQIMRVRLNLILCFIYIIPIMLSVRAQSETELGVFCGKRKGKSPNRAYHELQATRSKFPNLVFLYENTKIHSNRNWLSDY